MNLQLSFCRASFSSLRLARAAAAPMGNGGDVAIFLLRFARMVAGTRAVRARLGSSLLALLLLVACKGADPTDSNAIAPDQSCRTAAEELRRWSIDVVSEGLAQRWKGSYGPPRIAQKPSWGGLGPIILVAEYGVLLNSAFIADIEPTDILQRELIAALQALGPSPWPKRLAVMTDASWRTVVAVVDGLKNAGFHEVAFIFRGTSGVEPPPPGELSNLDAVLARCESAVKMMPTVSDMPFRERMETLARDLADKLIECDCRADNDSLRRITWAVMGRASGDPITEVRVEFPSDRDTDRTIRVAPTTPWREIYPRLISETKTTWRFELDI